MVIEIRKESKRMKELLYFIARYQIDKDTTKWNEYRERQEWDELEEMEKISPEEIGKIRPKYLKEK